MTNDSLLGSLGVILVVAALVAAAARAARVPTIVAYIATGLLLGPATGVLTDSDEIGLLSEVGIVLLLFLVGLELRIDTIRDVGRVSVTAGAIQIVSTAAAGFVLGLLLGFPPAASGFVALTVAFSSTVVVVKLLEEQRMLHRRHGRTAVAILLVQDFAVLLVMTFLAGIGTQGTVTLSTALGGLGQSFLGMGVLVLAALLAGRYVLPRAFTWISNLPEAMFIWSLSWCFLFVVSAEQLGLAAEIGGFLGGVSLAQLPYNQNLLRQVRPLMNFFIAVFFVGLGIDMELQAARELLIPAVVLSAAVLIGKPAIVYWSLRRGGYTVEDALRTGMALGQVSEFSFLAAATGLQLGLIDESILSLIGILGLITMAASSYLILYDRRIVAILGPRLGAGAGGDEATEETDESVRSGHVIVVGMNDLGARIVHHLVARGERVLAIDTDRMKLEGLPCETLIGNVDYHSVLEEANLTNAKLVVSALQIEDSNNLLAYRCGETDVPSSIHAFDRSVVEELRAIGVSHLMLPKNVGIRRIAARLQQENILPR